MSRRTVRLPIRGGRTMKRRISERIATDNKVFARGEDLLLEQMPDPQEVDVFEILAASVREFAAENEFGEEWIASRVSVAGSLAVRYRSEWKRLLNKSKKRFGGEGQVSKRSMAEAIDSSVGGWGVYSPLALKHNFDRAWEDINAELMSLVVSGEGQVSLNVYEVGDIKVRGAGSHPHLEGGKVVSVTLEERADRYYLNVAVESVLEPNKKLNRSTDGVIKVVLSQATMAADDKGVSLLLASESDAIWRSRQRILRARDNGVRTPLKLNRRLMNQRYNWYKQYALRLAEYARQNNLGIEISAGPDAPESRHPRLLTMSRSMRSVFMRTIISTGFRHGVYVRVSNETQRLDFSRCRHREASAVSGLVSERGLMALCDECANKSVVV